MSDFLGLGEQTPPVSEIRSICDFRRCKQKSEKQPDSKIMDFDSVVKNTKSQNPLFTAHGQTLQLPGHRQTLFRLPEAVCSNPKMHTFRFVANCEMAIIGRTRIFRKMGKKREVAAEGFRLKWGCIHFIVWVYEQKSFADISPS